MENNIGVNTQLNTQMSAGEKALLDNQVNIFNKKNMIEGRQPSQQLGKDDFLKLLITQLSNQDPTSPMENTEFIAQMAQFSSLEQMTNMCAGFTKLSSMMSSSSAVNTIGRTVDIQAGDDTIQGVVEAVSYGEVPQVKVNGTFFDMAKIQAVYAN